MVQLKLLKVEQEKPLNKKQRVDVKGLVREKVQETQGIQRKIDGCALSELNAEFSKILGAMKL